MMKVTLLGVFCAILYLYLTGKESLVKNYLEEEYDYLIVGAGSAGSIVAARLSEDSNQMVAVLEAGQDKDDNPEIFIPSMAATNSLGENNWFYPATQKMIFEGMTEERKYSYHAGKLLGGGSSINFMIAARGSPHDYDNWEAMGNEGWSYKDVLPYFKKVERITMPDGLQSEYRGTDGSVGVEEAHVHPLFLDAFLKGAKSMGFSVNTDYNGKDNIGASKGQLNVEGGVRQSSTKYLKPAMRRPNLHVITMAHVSKVLFEGKKAVGIEYLHDGRMRQVRARKEVILSAGNFGSAKLLLLSGVGPKDNLIDLKIPLIVDLPVGQNIQDHVGVELLSYSFSPGIIEKPSFLDELKYNIFGTGLLSSSGLAAKLYHHAEHQPKDKSYPYIELMLLTTLVNPDPATGELFRSLLNLKEEVFEEAHMDQFGKTGVTVLPILLHPNSRMSIKLNSTNPFDEAFIESQFLSDSADEKIIYDGIKAAISIMESPPMKEILSTRIKNADSRCKAYEYDSEDFWRCQIRATVFSALHATGSCMMGRKDNTQAVVDATLRVHGVEGLRVVDASVMPETPSGNINFPSMMIGEKAADMIRGIKP